MNKNQLEQLEALRESIHFALRNMDAIPVIARNMARTGISLDDQRESDLYHARLQLLRIMRDIQQELLANYGIEFPLEGEIEQREKVTNA